MTMFLRRRATFSAGYSRPLPGLGGGHTFVCELTVAGRIDPRTGMVVNIKDIDAVLQSRVISPLHGKLLDRDLPVFREIPATPENLVRFLWDACWPALPAGGRLARFTLWPLPTFWAECSDRTKKGAGPMLTVTRAYDFSASHRLHSALLSEGENADVFGKCNWANGHGHNYEVEVTLAGEPDPKTGRIVCPDLVDRIVDEEVLQPYDHKHLNFDTADFADLNPTSENLTRVIWEKLAPRFGSGRKGEARLHRVVVRETARNYFEYSGEDTEENGTQGWGN